MDAVEWRHEMPRNRKNTTALERALAAATRDLSAALTAAHGARRLGGSRSAEPAIVAAALRASRAWCASAAAHLERAIAAADKET